MRLSVYVLVVGILGPLAAGIVACRSDGGWSPGGTGGWGGDVGIGGIGGWAGDVGIGGWAGDIGIGGIGGWGGSIGGWGGDVGIGGIGGSASDIGIGGYGGWAGSPVGQGDSIPARTTVPSAQDTCNQLMAVTCERAFACGGGAALTEQYASATACTAALQGTTCASSQSVCGAGQTYHADMARQCAEGLRSEPCADFARGVEPTACGLVCGG